MDVLQRVTFRCGAKIEVRYLPDVPEPGDLVTHRGDLWFVSFVTADRVGTIVVCDLPRGDGSRFENVA